MVLGTKVAFSSLINVGSGFHCLRIFSFLSGNHLQLKFSAACQRQETESKPVGGSPD